MRAPALLACLLAPLALAAAPCPPPLLPAEPKDPEDLARVVRESFVKYEYRIPMRDGVTLYTVAFVPRQRDRRYPILLTRTPYGVSYGVDVPPELKTLRHAARFAPSMRLVQEGYIFVHQDVRGRLMSGGDFVEVRPKAAP